MLGGAWVADPRTITAALVEAGYRDRRRRVFTGALTVAVVLAQCLYRRESYDLVIGRVLAEVPRSGWRAAPAGRRCRSPYPAGRRGHAGGVDHAAAAMPAPGGECYAFGLLVTAFDGTVVDLAATDDIRAVDGSRVVPVVVCGLRWVLATRLGCCSVSEPALADQLAGQIRSGTLNLADRP